MFLDESGDLGQKGSDHLVISALLVKDPKPLKKLISNMRRNKFKKELKKANEIKAASSSDDVRKHMIQKLNNINDAQIYCVVFNKKLNGNPELQKDKHRLYNHIAGGLASQIDISDNIVIRIDKSKNKQVLRKNFDKHFLNNLKTDSSLRDIDIFHSYSHAWHGLQFADMIAWAYFQKFERQNSFYVDLISLECNIHELIIK